MCFEKDSCIREMPNEIQHQGQCNHCRHLNCPPFSKCMLSGASEPYCACRDVTKCPREHKQSCDQEMKVYRNLCVLKADSCVANKTVQIQDSMSCAARFFSHESFMILRSPYDIQSDRTDILIHVRPINKNGVLLYVDSRQSIDFLSLALIDGFLVYRHELGSGRVEQRSIARLPMHQWNKIIISRRGNSVDLNVDTTIARSRRAAAVNTMLNVDSHVYLGGLDTRKESHEEKIGTSISYHGCIKGLVINGEEYDLHHPGNHVLRQGNIRSCANDPCEQRPCLNGGTCELFGESYRCVCLDGFVGKKCQSKDHSVYLHGHNSHFSTPSMNERWLFSFSMEIRPKERNALIFSGTARHHADDCLILDMNDGYVELRLNVGTGLNIFRTRKRLALHIWHNISVTRDSDGVNLIVDDEIIQMSSKPSSLAVQLRGNLTFGSITHPIDRIIVRANTGFNDFHFTGCLRKIILTHYVMDLNVPSEDLSGYSGMKKCSSCVGSPCGIHGNCIRKLDLTFKCACFEKYVTDLCKFKEKPRYFKSMESYLSFPLIKGYKDFKLSFQIRPEIPNALLVYMNGKLNKDHFAIAIIDSILQLRINAGSGQVIARLKKPLTLLAWHKIDVERNEQNFTITLDNDQSASIILSRGFTILDLKGEMFIGSPSTPVGRIIAREQVPLRYLQFIGCFRRFYVDERRINLDYPTGDVLKQNDVGLCNVNHT